MSSFTTEYTEILKLSPNVVKDRQSFAKFVSSHMNSHILTFEERNRLKSWLGNVADKSARDKLSDGLTKWIAFSDKTKPAPSPKDEEEDYDFDSPPKEDPAKKAGATGKDKGGTGPKHEREASKEEIDLVIEPLNVKELPDPYAEHDLEGYCNKAEIVLGNISDMTAIMKAVEFEGLNHVAILNKLRYRAKIANISKSTFIYHMRLLVAVYIERGSSFLFRGIEKMSNYVVRMYIKALIPVYDILKEKPLGGYKSNDVSLARIVAIFPMMVAELMKKAKKVPIAANVSPNVPSWYKFPGGASLIPRGEEEFFNQWKAWYEEFGKVINRGKKQDDTRSNADYAQAIWNSSVTDETERKAVCAHTSGL